MEAIATARWPKEVEKPKTLKEALATGWEIENDHDSYQVSSDYRTETGIALMSKQVTLGSRVFVLKLKVPFRSALHFGEPEPIKATVFEESFPAREERWHGGIDDLIRYVDCMCKVFGSFREADTHSSIWEDYGKSVFVFLGHKLDLASEELARYKELDKMFRIHLQRKQ